ncbi:MAG: hypothetical protein A2550_01475, partial [Candidatus Jacksonbacteria bacterium RIFOXYD2_FULL_43_21]
MDPVTSNPIDEGLANFDPAATMANLDWVQILAWVTKAVIWGGSLMLSALILAMVLSFWLYWRRTLYRDRMPFVTIAIDIPPMEIKSAKAIENIIAQLYAIKSKFRFHHKWLRGQYTLQTSLDIVGQDGYVQFLVCVPDKYQNLLEKAVYAQYPDAHLRVVPDYTREFKPEDFVSENPATGRYDLWGTEFVMTRPSFFPLRTYPLFVDASGKEFSDPLAAVLEMVSHLKRGERFWYQVTIVPTRKDWQAEGIKAIQAIIKRKNIDQKPSILGAIMGPFTNMINEVLRVSMEGLLGSPSEQALKNQKKKDPDVVSMDAEQKLHMVPPEFDLVVKAMREKLSRLGFSTFIRALYIAPVDVYDKRRVSGDFLGIMRQFTNPQLNSLASNIYIEADFPEIFFPKLRAKWRKKRLLRRAQKRYAGAGVDDTSPLGPFQKASTRNIFSIEEVATMWHFPLMELADKSGLLRRVLSKKVHPKQPLPEGEEERVDPALPAPTQILVDPNITFFARTNFRGLNRKFGIKREDRRRHMYVIGKTGMGKTTMLENMVYQDILRGEGVAVIDPHGDLVDNIVNMIPPSRINDTIYFNPADKEFPVAFNILGEENLQHRYLVVSSLVGIFKKIWADSWGPRLEYLLRNSLITLMEAGNSTILGVPRIFVDNKYRKKLVDQITDPVIKSFWINEYAKYNQTFQVEAVNPIQNKIGQFISIPLIRNMIGQVKSKLNFREILDDKKIFLVNLAKGLIGEDVSSLLGATIISKLQIAAMMRADVPEEERPDFYLYIDEFQNFSTESFATILSEARKYRLNLIMAHQYIEQLDELVAAAVFGNVGTMVCFGMGSDDAETLEPHFATEFVLQDLVNLGKYETIMRLMVDGATSRPFSAETLGRLGSQTVSCRDRIIKVSRERYAVPRVEVEEKLERWLAVSTSPEPALPPGRPGPSGPAGPAGSAGPFGSRNTPGGMAPQPRPQGAPSGPAQNRQNNYSVAQTQPVSADCVAPTRPATAPARFQPVARNTIGQVNRTSNSNQFTSPNKPSNRWQENSERAATNQSKQINRPAPSGPIDSGGQERSSEGKPRPFMIKAATSRESLNSRAASRPWLERDAQKESGARQDLRHSWDQRQEFFKEKGNFSYQEDRARRLNQQQYNSKGNQAKGDWWQDVALAPASGAKIQENSSQGQARNLENIDYQPIWRAPRKVVGVSAKAVAPLVRQESIVQKDQLAKVVNQNQTVNNNQNVSAEHQTSQEIADQNINPDSYESFDQIFGTPLNANQKLTAVAQQDECPADEAQFSGAPMASTSKKNVPLQSARLPRWLKDDSWQR